MRRSASRLFASSLLLIGFGCASPLSSGGNGGSNGSGNGGTNGSGNGGTNGPATAAAMAPGTVAAMARETAARTPGARRGPRAVPA